MLSAQEITRRGRLLQTGEISCRHVGDGGDHRKGLGKAYYVLDAGQYALTANIEVASYAANTLAFVLLTSKITDSANGLAHIKTGDTIVVKGSTSNDGVYTVATGNVAAEVVVNEALVDELAGAYVSIYKRVAHSNNCVFDRRTGVYWSRYTSSAELVGEASDGNLIWADVTKVYTLHPAAADIQIYAAPWNAVKIIGGAAEVTRYHVGDLLDFAGFANAANNLPGYYVTSVMENALDLDIVVDPVNNILVEELAPGAVSIGLVTRSIYNYAAGARTASLAGYTDWRAPDDTELDSLREMEAPTAAPDAVAFPGWSVATHWTSTTTPDAVANAQAIQFSDGQKLPTVKTAAAFAALVRS